MEIAVPAAEPCLIVESDCINDQRVALPVSDRVAAERLLHRPVVIVWTIQSNHSVIRLRRASSVEIGIEKYDPIALPQDFLRWSHARDAFGHTLKVRILFQHVFSERTHFV